MRTDEERKIATISFARSRSTRRVKRRLMSSPKDAKVVFHCHHGMRSRQAAEQALRAGFTDVYNLEGGIDALVDGRRLDRSPLLISASAGPAHVDPCVFARRSEGA